ncbi:hypothetical protein CWC27_20645, partial [Pseudoalteromonas sp. S4491]
CGSGLHCDEVNETAWLAPYEYFALQGARQFSGRGRLIQELGITLSEDDSKVTQIINYYTVFKFTCSR